MPHFLTDTHALIWWWNADDRLSEAARATLSARENDIFISCVSAWEIANKVRIGKLPEMAPFLKDYDMLVTEGGFRHLDLHYQHALDAGGLLGEHRDPFDRLLAAQALINGYTVITRDHQFEKFGCKVLW